MFSALRIKSFRGDLLIYLRITWLDNEQYDMRRKGQLNVSSCRTQICDKRTKVLGPLCGIR